MAATSELKYKSLLNRRETEKAIDLIKTKFPKMMSEKLNLFKVSCPLIIMDGTGINDDLSGTERPVKFPIKIKGMLPELWCNHWQNGNGGSWLNSKPKMVKA